MKHCDNMDWWLLQCARAARLHDAHVKAWQGHHRAKRHARIKPYSDRFIKRLTKGE